MLMNTNEMTTGGGQRESTGQCSLPKVKRRRKKKEIESL